MNPFVAVGAVLAGGYFLYKGLKGKSRTPQFQLHEGDLVGLVGDSLAVGLGPPLQQALAARGVALDARGKGATITGGWLVFPELEAILSRHPRAVVVSLGTNDCHLEGRPCTSFPTNIQTLADRIRQAGATAVLLGMPPMPWETSQAGFERMSVARTALRNAADVYIPPVAIERSPDGIHASGKGYKTWADWIAEVLT